MRCSMRGFTLIELVIVIILLSILSISIAGILSSSVSSYMDSRDRNRHSQEAKLVIERMSREIREALPQSVRTRINGSVHCVEFTPIVNASSDIDLPASGPVTSFNAVAYNLIATFSPNQAIAIMPINAANFYAGGGTRGTVAAITPSGANQVQITLASPTNFARRSPLRRFYLLSQPVSFCLDDASGEVRRYTNYGFNAAQAAPPTGASELYGQNFAANGNVFTYQPGTLQNASLLQMNFVLQSRSRNLAAGEESFEVFHEVHIRNVP